MRSRATRCVSATFEASRLAVEHALAEKGAAHRDAIEAADELAVAPAFDRMGEAHVE